MKEKTCIIGLDGGASRTRGVLIDKRGMTLASVIRENSTNISYDIDKSSDCIISIIKQLCNDAKVLNENIIAIGLGLAGSSNQDGRDMVFGKLDRMSLSDKTLIMNDAEAAYELGCPSGNGILVTVGTGVICLSRLNGGTIRVAGKGHDSGDVGSGYWIGKQAIVNLTLNETSVMGDPDLEEIMSIVMNHIGGKDFQKSLESLHSNNDSVSIIASIAKDIIYLAEKGNEVSVSIIQEATHAVSEYIISILEQINYDQSNLILSGNGSIISNNYYRSSLNDELRFHFPELKWTFSKISAAYGSAILAGRVKNIEIKISDILKGDIIVSA